MYMLAEIHRRSLNEFGRRGDPFFFCIDFSGEHMDICVVEKAYDYGFRFSFPGRQDEMQDIEVILKVYPPNYRKYKRSFYFLQDKIKAGYSVLANLTWPVAVECDFSLKEIYLASRAPYRILKKNTFVCFSPETFIRIKKNRIETRPMKGTRKVSQNENVDEVAKQLLDDLKEKAEHYAVTDLLRNDLNQVARKVIVEKFRYVDTLKTRNGFLLQTSSLISGLLPSGWQRSLGDILTRLLPAGSVTGAPKREVVRLLQECEIEPRGWYCGIAGYFDGEELDSCVLIRFIEQREGNYFFRTGGGITIDSNPYCEYQELLEKIYVPLYRNYSL